MKKRNGKRIVSFIMILSLLLSMSPLTGLAAQSGKTTSENSVVPPTTGFEDRNGDSYTTHAEELAFLEEVAAKSERVAYSEVGTSIEGRPLHLVRVSYPEPPSDEDIAGGQNILVIGSQHGNEPAGREMALQLLRDLAFTDDPELLDQLSETTVLIVPSANPDGREADTRGNAWGTDINRDHLNLRTPEGQTIAQVLRDFKPDITIDAHEGPSTPDNPGQTPRLELSWPRNLNVDEELRALNVEMVENYVFPAIEDGGFDTDVYGSPGGAGGGDERISRNVLGLRHGIGMLIETFNATPAARVDLQLRTIHEVLKFHRERGDDVARVVAEAPDRKMAAGGDQSEPFYLGGSDWEPPMDEDILDIPPCGYLINTVQADQIDRLVEMFPLVTEKVSENGVFITMNQPMMTVVPLLLDERAAFNEVDGIALYDCSDPGSVEPPTLPEQSDPAQYETGFAEYEVGESPAGWSPLWREGSWTVLDEPRRLEHMVDGSGRRALTWDAVDEVSGDVEVSGVVRANGVNETALQLGFHMSGEAGSENAYYLDVRSPNAGSDANHVRINRYLNGVHQKLGSVALPFTVTENTWYHVVVQREGDTMRAKVWPNGENEPSAWQVMVVDRSFNQGRVGVSHFTPGTVNEWAFIGVGTGGESAPRAPEDLLPKFNKTLLQDRVNEINGENLNEADYTEENWQTLQDALETANSVLNDPETTQQEIDDALAALNKARAGLYITGEIGDRRVPDPLVSVKGEEIQTAEQWLQIRRLEILDLFREHIYGWPSVERPDSLQFDIVDIKEDMMDGEAIRKQIDISYEGPGGEGEFRLLLFVPANAEKPVPTFLFINNRGYENMDPDRETKTPFWPAEYIVDRGYATAVFQVSEVAPDSPGSFEDGVHGIFDPEGDRPSNAWGTIAAWAWGASRAMDYLETDPDIDTDRVAVVGHSRGGKAALWAGATDERFDLVVSNDSGSTGAAIARGKKGETIEQINTGFPHWFNENYKNYNGKEDELPVDQHMLIASIAPRLVYVASASQDTWADPESEFLSLVYAEPVYRLFGYEGLGTTQFPENDSPLHKDGMGYHVRTGSHNLTMYDWKNFMDFWGPTDPRLELQIRVDEITAENLDESVYTEESWEALQQALEEAENVLNNPNASESELKTALASLNEARAGLETFPAQYEIKFTEDEIGGPPAGWSSLWRDSNWTVRGEPRRLEHAVVGDNGDRRALTWDEVGEVNGDVEVSGVVRAGGVKETMFQIGLHMSGEAEGENAYYLDVKGPKASSDPNRVRINSYKDGSYQKLGTAPLPFTVTENTWYHVLLQREGDAIRAKMWPYGENEPAAWQVTVEDRSFNQGRVGVSHFTAGAVNEWAFIGVGTGDKPAPRAPEDLFEPADPEVDKTALQSRVNEINGENLSETDYTEESWEALRQALATAENVLNDPEAAQSEVDTALAALNEARAGLEEAAPISASRMEARVERFAEEGAFGSDHAAHSLTMHLTAVNLYEEKELADKVVKHMEGFKLLLDYQRDNSLISEEAYNALYSDTEGLIEKWR